MSLMSI